MVRRSVSLMDHAINRMVNIIRQLGTIASNERIELTTLPVIQLLENTVDRFKVEYKVNAFVSIETEFDGEPTISANAETFEIVLGKLLIKACESYSKDTVDKERKIILATKITRERGPAMLEMNVVDTGGGISPEVKDTLFVPFITTKTSVGRGMGLTIARHTARNLEGDVQVKANKAGGVTATLSHPI